MSIFANRARLVQGWADGVRIEIQGGLITSVQVSKNAQPGDARVDVLLPAPANLHSHSFQRAMAGMTEYRAKDRESFWTWRELMYRFLDRLTPDHVQAFAAMTFMEMQMAGYAAVGEFHYVHHQNGGQPYDDPAELSLRIFEAAKATGIGLTHLPVLYTYGNALGQELAGGQLRFGNSVDEINGIYARCHEAMKSLPGDARIGIAPHSLRATNADDLKRLLSDHATGPVHIHAAEQFQEVEDIKSALGTSPVEWLLENAGVDERWCLIHTTHMTDEETNRLARSGAVAGLCPVTEANLGDGIFNGRTYIKTGGRFGIGSDSNVNISLNGELRQLEYSQRLRDQERNVMIVGDGSVGEALYLGAAKGSAQALDRNAGRIAKGALADLVALNSAHPALCALKDEQLLDGFVFAANGGAVTDLWSAGRHQVQNSRHVAQDQVTAAYRNVIGELLG